MSFRRIVWLSMTIFVLVIFFSVIPVHVYEKHYIIYSIVGGVLLFVCLFQLMGDFETLYDVFHHDFNEEKDSWRKFAPAAVLPALLWIFILVANQSGRKERELTTHGTLTKGMITGGYSTTTKRRLQSNTSYSVQVTFVDSLQTQHVFQASVKGSEFSNRYEGERVDVVYSKLHPSLATLVLNVNDLPRYVKIPHEKLTVNHLLAILESKGKQDSILSYLNSINYEWTPNGRACENKKLGISVICNTEEQQVVFLKRDIDYGSIIRNDFESSLNELGFKKKSSTVSGESKEIFYNERYIVRKKYQTDQFERPSGIPLVQITQTYIIEKLAEGDVAVD